jgi:ketosteroid isomerase-like protein
MTTRHLPPTAVVIGFIDRINRGDARGLGELMTDDHQLLVYDEPPVSGRDANIAAWQGYADAYPGYVIYPRRLAEPDDLGSGTAGRVAVLGTTTGSHLGLPDEEERKLTLIWLAEAVDGRLRSWRLLPDTPENRKDLGLDAV